MEESGERSPWICHVCDSTGRGEAQSCALCYMVTCPSHLQLKVVLNAGSGLYEFQSVCLLCATAGLH
jgi:hypothetical protein